jgi:hypothetical protein
MKAGSPGNAITIFISRLAIASIAGALAITVLGFAAAPDLRAETPPDQIKIAGAIPLTTQLLDKMDKFIKNESTDDAATTELAAIAKDPEITPENWGSVVTAKCPKTVEIFKASGVTPDEFGKAFFALMVIGLSDDMAKSEDKTARANAEFFAANKDRASATYASFMVIADP